jgi:hypothetical protein
VFCHGQLLYLDVVVVLINLGLDQGYTNPGHQIAQETQFCVVTPNICGSSVWNFLYITLLAPRILMWLQGLWEINEPLGLIEWPFYPFL